MNYKLHSWAPQKKYIRTPKRTKNVRSSYTSNHCIKLRKMRTYFIIGINSEHGTRSSSWLWQLPDMTVVLLIYLGLHIYVNPNLHDHNHTSCSSPLSTTKITISTHGIHIHTLLPSDRAKFPHTNILISLSICHFCHLSLEHRHREVLRLLRIKLTSTYNESAEHISNL
jgi:hypothetical protein